MIKLKDVNGMWRFFDELAILEALAVGDFQIYGMCLENIIDLKAEYERRDGSSVMTSQSIREAFVLRQE